MMARIKSIRSRTKVHILRQLNHFQLLGMDDVCFIIHPGNKGWILDALCREIANYYPGRSSFHYSCDYLPAAQVYFFSHYSLLPLALRKNPWIRKAKILVWYTHPKSLESYNISEQELIHALNSTTKIICTCSSFVDHLKVKGVSSDRLTYVLGAADPEIFIPHERGTGGVGFSTAYYARKSPDRVFEIIKLMPHQNFILLGKNWKNYDRFSELTELENFTYVEAPYSEYPTYYNSIDVFVSPAKLEGGPISLIETMMCNVVPVASETGFAPDIISHGKNGFLFDVESSPEEVCTLIEKAFQLKANVRESVEHLSWKNFSHEIQSFFH